MKDNSRRKERATLERERIQIIHHGEGGTTSDISVKKILALSPNAVKKIGGATKLLVRP